MVYGEYAIHRGQEKSAIAVSVKRRTKSVDGSRRMVFGERQADPYDSAESTADRVNDVLHGIGILVGCDEPQRHVWDSGAPYEIGGKYLPKMQGVL